jgi:hypothetical protein
VFISLSGEVYSIAAGHFFEFCQTFANFGGRRDRCDAARVHDLKVTQAVVNQLFNQVIFEPNKAGHHK